MEREILKKAVTLNKDSEGLKSLITLVEANNRLTVGSIYYMDAMMDRDRYENVKHRILEVLKAEYETVSQEISNL